MIERAVRRHRNPLPRATLPEERRAAASGSPTESPRLSMLAATQASIIMMGQNRLAATDRRQARRDFEINLKAELEILALHSKLDQLLEGSRGPAARNPAR